MFENFVELDENLSDDELISRINAGEYDKLQLLINRYMPLIGRIAARFEGSTAEYEDLVQEGMFAVFSAAGAFDPKKASFPTFAELCISRAMASLCRSACGVRRIPDKLITPIDDVDISDDNDPESIFIERESFKFFARDIRVVLSRREYNVLCAFFSGQSYAEISQSLGISVKSVDNSMKRIRDKLRK